MLIFQNYTKTNGKHLFFLFPVLNLGPTYLSLALKWQKLAEGSAKSAQGVPKLVTSRPQVGSKLAQGGPKLAPVGPKSANVGPSSSQDGPNVPEIDRKFGHVGPKVVPSWHQIASQDGPSWSKLAQDCMKANISKMHRNQWKTMIFHVFRAPFGPRMAHVNAKLV